MEKSKLDYAFNVIQRNAKANPRKQFGGRENDDCECGGSMRLRINGFTGEPFLGCSNYPTCRNSDQLMTSERNRFKFEEKELVEKDFHQF